jgi:hypothetical protein
MQGGEGSLRPGTSLANTRAVHRKLAFLVVFSVALVASVAAARSATPPLPERAQRAAMEDAPALVLGWRPSVSGRRNLTAVALDPASGRAALGDAHGVVLLAPGGGIVESLSRPDVTALVFTESGALLVGTAHGLFARDGDGALVDRSPAPGEDARSIARLASCADFVAVATAAGIYLSRDARTWQPVSGPLARAQASAVTLRCREGRAELRAVAGGDVWGAVLLPGADEVALASAAPVDGLDAGVRARAVDVLLSPDGAEVVLAPELFALRVGHETDWRILRPVLAPGASLVRVAEAAGRRWLATDRGLFAEGPAGAWTRLPADAPSSAVRDVAGDAARVLAATEDGLREAELAEARPAASGASARRAVALALEFPGAPEPAVQEIFRAAVAYQALRPEEIQNLKRGLAARGLFPELELRFQRDRSHDQDLDYDEVFVSGDLRRLNDRHGTDARDVSASLHLTWALGDLAFSPDAIDLSKEARAVVQLRDDVLDEVTHLFFERRRVLLELAALGPAPDAQEAERLRLRADELAAGLDAWTGGWFGQRVPPLAHGSLLHPEPRRMQ